MNRPKTALERIGVGTSTSDPLEDPALKVRQQIARSAQSTIQETQESDRENLRESLATNIRPERDFGSLQEAGSFVDDLRSQRQNEISGRNDTRQQAYNLTPNGSIDLNSVSPDLAWLISKESGGDPNAKNPKSSAFGVGQLIKANRVHYGGQLGFDPDTTNPNEQFAMMMAYIKDRYGTVANARRFWEANGHY